MSPEFGVSILLGVLTFICMALWMVRVEEKSERERQT